MKKPTNWNLTATDLMIVTTIAHDDRFTNIGSGCFVSNLKPGPGYFSVRRRVRGRQRICRSTPSIL